MPCRSVPLHIIEMIERHMPSSQHTGVCGGIFAQCIVTAHDVTIEFECAIRQEAISPSGRVLSVNGLATARAELLDGKFCDDGTLIKGLLSSPAASQIAIRSTSSRVISSPVRS
jgi:hypothetical protein